ncbi:hypothetical protein [Candidatus Nitrotoga arctica]|uniref:Uncharacterized protein n=1 Tax=Candidatus Nitrotoga arctica TaxID=453162 RepID=A0ABM8YWX4_9PROT|nr:hypothetical protein [Candidatus Nitrotoga arctica]CAG9931995.1 protein of unknown function [Candidatus Nitrotoga arctica]
MDDRRSQATAVETVVTGSRLTLSNLGRGLTGSVGVKQNIERLDRLLGNNLLHTKYPSCTRHLSGSA